MRDSIIARSTSGLNMARRRDRLSNAHRHLQVVGGQRKGARFAAHPTVKVVFRVFQTENIDLPVSAVTGGARIALQVISNHPQPLLEVYANLRHRMRPKEVTTVPASFGGEPREYRYRPQDIFVEFVLVNLGGTRAEKVRLGFIGRFEVHSGHTKLQELPLFNGQAIPQLPPAGVFPLFTVDHLDLYERDKTGKTVGMKQPGFSITAGYYAPWAGLNRVRRLPTHVFRRPQFRMRFDFNPMLYQSLPLPPAEYQ